MTNEERRAELARARRFAVTYAEQAEAADLYDAYGTSRAVRLATMWAHVAMCLKVGDPVGPDRADGHPEHITIP